MDPTQVSAIQTLQAMGLLGATPSAPPSYDPVAGPPPQIADPFADTGGIGSPPDLSLKQNALINPQTGDQNPAHLPDAIPTSQQELPPAPPPAQRTARPDRQPDPLTDVAGADRAMTQAVDSAGQAEIDAGQADVAAKAAAQERAAAGLEKQAQGLQEEADRQVRDREAVHKATSAETAAWMKQVDEQAAKEPDHRRYWEHSSGFSKALWLAGLAFGALAESKGGQNTSAKLLLQAVDEDVAAQKERLGRQMEALKKRGEIMREEHAQRLTDLKDDATMRVQRLNVLGKAIDERAKAPGPEDYKAALLRSKATVEQAKVQLATKRYEETRKALESKMNRDAEMSRLAYSQSHEDARHALDIKKDYDLANLQAGVKLAEAKDKAKGETLTMPRASGVEVHVKGPDGKVTVEELQLPKGKLGEDAYDDVKNTQAKLTAFSKLYEKLGDVGWTSRVLNNDADFRQALAATVDPMVRQLGGRFNKDTAGSATEMALGMDISSLRQRILGAGPEKMREIIAEQLRDEPAALSQRLAAIPNNNLVGRNGEIHFTPAETRTKPAPDVTGDEAVTAATGKAPGVLHIEKAGDVEEYGSAVQERLNKTLSGKGEPGAVLNENLKRFEDGLPPDAVATTREKAISTLDAWAKDHPDGKKSAEDAKRIIEERGQEAEKKARDALAATREALFKDVQTHTYDRPPPDVVKAIADREGLTNLGTSQVRDLAEEAARTLKSLKSIPDSDFFRRPAPWEPDYGKKLSDIIKEP